MAENVPPSTAANTTPITTTPSKPAASVPGSTETRGLPYYESLRRTLRDTLSRKRLLDRNLAALEETIHREESRYLEETSSAGNIVKGFDNYIKASATSTATGAAGGGTISGSAVGGTGRGSRKAVLSDSDRVFSRSSVGWAARNGEDGLNGTVSGQGSAVSTPGASTPGPDESRRKKKTKREDESESRLKRQKISFGPRKGDD